MGYCMDSGLKKYIELNYKEGTVRKEVKDWGPNYLPCDKNIRKVRFLSEFVNNDGSFNGSTSWIYFGEKVNFLEAKRLFGSIPSYEVLLSDIEKNNLSACFTQDGDLLIMEDGAVMVDEYIDEYNKVREGSVVGIK
ncbi:MAG: hypothetical protein IJ475_01015 [Bacilli bacterium]|nr:hypothetical protein [Bacilli bacterium]